MTEIISKASTPQYRANYDRIDWGEHKRKQWKSPILFIDDEEDDGGYDVSKEDE